MEQLGIFTWIWCDLRNLSAMTEYITEKLSIVKKRISDWPSNNRKIKSYNDFKVSFLKRLYDIFRGFSFWCVI